MNEGLVFIGIGLLNIGLIVILLSHFLFPDYARENKPFDPIAVKLCLGTCIAPGAMFLLMGMLS